MTLLRRSFLKRAGTTAATLLFPRGLPAQSYLGRRPNILVCIADDWGYGYASIYGDQASKTPVFDRLAREGALFTRAFCVSPTCSAARAGILTGQPPHRLEQGANLWGTLRAKFAVYPDLLESAGYVVGFAGKGYGPAIDGERARNPAGPRFANFKTFLASVPDDKPFCFWFGALDPHRPYDRNVTGTYEITQKDITVPQYLPDVPEVRDDLRDYIAEIRRFDADVGGILACIENSGRYGNTVVVITSDNGPPFPRAKANLYDVGTRVPLAILIPDTPGPGQTIDVLVSHLDIAPTLLDLAGLQTPPEVAGRSLLELVSKGRDRSRRQVFLERERHHGRARVDGSGYPSRGIRTDDYLYIRNYAPDRWPAGDPSKATVPLGDVDDSPTKT
jgi:N-sulfoglucosamine sulfohydrolase